MGERERGRRWMGVRWYAVRSSRTHSSPLLSWPTEDPEGRVSAAAHLGGTGWHVVGVQRAAGAIRQRHQQVLGVWVQEHPLHPHVAALAYLHLCGVAPARAVSTRREAAESVGGMTGTLGARWG
jgi:hypothetical protein